jgi:hypothetical protein
VRNDPTSGIQYAGYSSVRLEVTLTSIRTCRKLLSVTFTHSSLKPIIAQPFTASCQGSSPSVDSLLISHCGGIAGHQRMPEVATQQQDKRKPSHLPAGLREMLSDLTLNSPTHAVIQSCMQASGCLGALARGTSQEQHHCAKHDSSDLHACMQLCCASHAQACSLHITVRNGKANQFHEWIHIAIILQKLCSVYAWKVTCSRPPNHHSLYRCRGSTSCS